jgi:peptidoglycan/LPS O-acetylase OafA/YrhL
VVDLAVAVHAIDTRTPATRDRALDGLRALALLGVVAGHWMVGALVHTPEGLRIDSPLRDMPWLAPASWVLQMLGIFFLVGGRVAAIGWTSERARGAPYATWLRRRFGRLVRPVVVVLVAWALAVPVLLWAGVPATTVRSAITLVLQPLWFVAVYVVLTALTPWVAAADRRFRVWALAPGVLVVAVVDLLRYGPVADVVPGWVQWLNLLPGWLFGYQLGIAWANGRFDGRRRWAALTAGAVVFLGLLVLTGYPLSMVGTPGEGRTNAHPPSLLVLALAATQSGAAMLLREGLAKALRRPRLWAVTVVVNVAAMSILCWHQTAALLPSLAAEAAGRQVPGLTTAPIGPEWLLTRLGWVPLLLILLVLACWLVRRAESGSSAGGRSRRQQVPHQRGVETALGRGELRERSAGVVPDGFVDDRRDPLDERGALHLGGHQRVG